MLDHILDEVLLAHLKTVPALAAINGYTGQDGADHKLPTLTVSTTSEPLAGIRPRFLSRVSPRNSDVVKENQRSPENAGERPRTRENKWAARKRV